MSESRSSIKKEFAKFLSKATVTAGILDAQVLIDAESLLKVLVASHGNWINKIDVFGIVHEIVSHAVRKKYGDISTLNGKIVSLFDVGELIEIQDSLVSRISDIPGEYCFWIPAPAIPMLGESFEISDNIRYEVINGDAAANIINGVLAKKGFARGSVWDDAIEKYGESRAYFVTSGNGYINASFSGSAFENALAVVKHLLVAGSASYLLTNSLMPRRHSDYTEGLCFVASSNDVKNIYDVFVAPYEVTCAILNHVYNPAGSVVDRVGVEEIRRKICQLGVFLGKSDSDIGRLAIANCTEWTFQAMANANLTFRFVQTCIALEALLGDEAGEKCDIEKRGKGQKISEPSTAQLADRLAYLIGGKREDRKAIRNEFFKIYQMRSELVHGKKRMFSLNSIEMLDGAQRLLLRAIDREIYLNIKRDDEAY